MLTALFRGFVYGNFWVGLSVAALGTVTFLQYGPWSFDYTALCFTSTVAFYGLARYLETPRKINNPSQSIAAWTISHTGIILVISVLAALASLILWFRLPPMARLVFAAAAFLSALYTIPALFNRNGVRYLAGVKLIHIALTWTVVTVSIPVILSGETWDLRMGLVHLERFAFILALTIPFDIRDARTDSTELLTLPMWLGESNARNIALAALSLAILLQFYPPYYGETIRWSQVAVYLAGGYLIHRSNEDQGDMFFSFWLEGLPVFLILALLIFP